MEYRPAREWTSFSAHSSFAPCNNVGWGEKTYISLSAILHFITSGVKPANFAELCAALVLENISIHGKDEVGLSITDRGWGVLYPYIHVPEENLEIKGVCVYPDVLL